MSDRGSLYNLIDKSLRLGGAVFEKCFNLTIDGFQDLIFSVIDYGADLSKIDRAKIIDFLQILNTRRTLACAIYPIDEIAKALEIDPDNHGLKIDHVEQLERQSILVMKLMEWMAFTPIERKAVKRMFKNVQEIRDEVGLSQLHYDEIKLIMANLIEEMNEALDEGDEETYQEILTQLIRCKILLSDNDDIDRFFELLEMFNKDQLNYLKGKYLLRENNYVKAYEYLSSAYKSDVPFAKDLLAQCLDELTKLKSEREKWVKIKRDTFGSIFNQEAKDSIRTLPYSFLQIKWKEIHKVFNNIKDSRENKSA